MTNYKKKKLLQIAEMLENHVDSQKLKFDMGVWSAPTLKGCGTACCAIGLAVNKKVLPTKFKLIADSPFYEGKSSISAVMKFFGISGIKAHRLFGSAAYIEPTPKNVAERIREFVETE